MARRRVQLKYRMAIASIAIRYFRKCAGGRSLAAHMVFQEEPVSQPPRTAEPSLTRFDHTALAPFAAGVPMRRRTSGRLTPARNAVDAIDVLATHYPVIHRLVGDDSFRAMARRFVARELRYFRAFSEAKAKRPRSSMSRTSPSSSWRATRPAAPPMHGRSVRRRSRLCPSSDSRNCALSFTRRSFSSHRASQSSRSGKTTDATARPA